MWPNTEYKTFTSTVFGSVVHTKFFPQVFHDFIWKEICNAYYDIVKIVRKKCLFEDNTNNFKPLSQTQIVKNGQFFKHSSIHLL